MGCGRVHCRLGRDGGDLVSAVSGGLYPGVPLHVLRKAIAKQNAKFGHDLQRIPREDWAQGSQGEGKMIDAMRSRHHLVQVFNEHPKGFLRMTVSRTSIGDDRRWLDGISWDDLMRLKREAGHGDRYAVEIFPADEDVVNVANMRHLWLLEEPPAYAWRKGQKP